MQKLQYVYHYLKLPIENYVLDYFVIMTLSLSPELMRRVCEGEAKGKNPLLFSIIGMSSFALLRTTPRGIEPARNGKKGGDPSASPQGDI